MSPYLFAVPTAGQLLVYYRLHHLNGGSVCLPRHIFLFPVSCILNLLQTKML